MGDMRRVKLETYNSGRYVLLCAGGHYDWDHAMALNNGRLYKRDRWVPDITPAELCLMYKKRKEILDAGR